MRIAQIAPLAEPVPPLAYGGTERVVANLTEGLVRRGHDVTLFASGDSRTSARLVACSERALRLDSKVRHWAPHVAAQLGRIAEALHADGFDIVHNHIDYAAFPLLAAFERQVPHVTTLHGRLDLPDLPAVFRVFGRAPVVSISDAQRVHLPWLRWVATVHHGIEVDRYPFSPLPGSYLAFLGRINPEKRPDRAVAIARAVGIPLKIAAKIDPVDRDYWHTVVEPLVDGQFVEYVGELTDAEKLPFLAGARALLFPIDWPEPFGLAMIEAMATGTPVLAMRHGSVPEVVVDGVSGFVGDSVQDLIDAVDRVGRLDRAAVRAEAARRFSIEHMVEGYERVYADLIAGHAGRINGHHVARVTRLPIAAPTD